MLPSMDLVYVFRVEDADADGWSAEVAVAAANPADASRRIRTAGLHKKQIHHDGRPVRVLNPDDLPELADSSSGILRRRLEADEGRLAFAREDAGVVALHPPEVRQVEDVVRGADDERVEPAVAHQRADTVELRVVARPAHARVRTLC
jgi:hypothetical protein